MSNFEPDEKMLNNYIQEKLNEADTKQLELWLADHPETLEELELGLMFSQADFDPIEKPKKSKSISFINFFTSRKLIPLHLLAYGLVGLLAISIFNTTSQINQGEGNFQIVSLSPLRGGNSVKEFNAITSVNVNYHINQIIIVIQLNFPDRESYSIELINNNSNNKIFEIDGLIPLGAGDLNISIPTKLIQSGNYWIIVKSSEEQVEKLPISFN